MRCVILVHLVHRKATGKMLSSLEGKQSWISARLRLQRTLPLICTRDNGVIITSRPGWDNLNHQPMWQILVWPGWEIQPVFAPSDLSGLLSSCHGYAFHRFHTYIDRHAGSRWTHHVVYFSLSSKRSISLRQLWESKFASSFSLFTKIAFGKQIVLPTRAQ